MIPARTSLRGQHAIAPFKCERTKVELVLILLKLVGVHVDVVLHSKGRRGQVKRRGVERVGE